MRRSLSTPALLVTLLTLILIGSSCSQDPAAGELIPASEAYKYVGKNKTVSGTVVAARYAAGSRGQPTFLNFEEPHPNQVFGVVIWGSDRSKFETPPESAFRGRQLHVTGLPSHYSIHSLRHTYATNLHKASGYTPPGPAATRPPKRVHNIGLQRDC